MNDSEIYNVVKSLVGYSESGKFSSIRERIKALLPIEHANGYYIPNKAEFYDPIQDQVFYRNYKFDDEKSRLDSIDYINGRIDYYNRLCDEEFKKSGAIYDLVDPLPLWGVRVTLSSSILNNDTVPNTAINKPTVRILNNEYLYKCLSLIHI